MLVLELLNDRVLSVDRESIGQTMVPGFFGLELDVTVAAAAAFLVMTNLDRADRPETATHLLEILGVQGGREVAYEEIMVHGDVFDVTFPGDSDRDLQDPEMVQVVLGPLGVDLVVERYKSKASGDLGFGILHDADRVERAVLHKDVVQLLVLNRVLHVSHVQSVHILILSLGQHLKINNNN